MKRIYLYLVAAMTIASAASCTEQISDTKRPAELGTMTISASMGTVSKTVYDNQSVLWEGDEQITVFSLGETVVDEAFEMSDCSQDKTKAQFTGIADLAADRYLAVYPHSAENSCTPEGTVSVSIPAVQTAVAGGFASGANVAVATFAKGDASVLFNNISTLISFGFDTDADAALTQSVTVKVKKNETDYYGIAGTVSVSCSDGELVVSEGTSEAVVVNAPEGGFVKGATYYVPVAPVGEIAGMELIYTDGTTPCTRRNDAPATFSRNSICALGQIPIAYDNLQQEDFEVKFDFTEEWPLTPACLASDDQTEQADGGDEYTYTYEYGDYARSLKTTFLRGASTSAKRIGYIHQDGVLMFAAKKSDGSWDDSNSSGFLSTPIIEERYLTSVKLELGVFRDDYSSYSAPLEFHYMGTKNKISGLSSSQVAVDNIVITLSMPSNNFGGELGEWVNIKFRGANIPVKKITMTYSKNK